MQWLTDVESSMTSTSTEIDLPHAAAPIFSRGSARVCTKTLYDGVIHSINGQFAHASVVFQWAGASSARATRNLML